MQKILAYSLVVVLGVFFSVQSASACSCIRSASVLEEASQADFIFSGVANPVGAAQGREFVDFDILQSWKGIDDVTTNITVETAEQPASCGYPFEDGLSYLVYAYYVRDASGAIETNSNGEKSIEVTACSRTKELLKDADVDRAILDDVLASWRSTSQDGGEDRDFSFVAMPRRVEEGGNVTVAWDVPGARWCLARGDWHGLRKTQGQKVIKNLKEDKVFTLQCFYGIIASQRRTVSVEVVPEDGANSGEVCAADVRICADGTAVGRTGPECRFACPDDAPDVPGSGVRCDADVDFDSVAQTFVPPRDPFAKNVSLAHPRCEGQDFVVQIGDALSPVQKYYIWHKAYYTTDGEIFSQDQSVRIDGPRDASGKWVVGGGEVRLPREQMQSEKEYLAFYVCIYENDQWRCGCSQEGECSDPEKGVYRWSLVGLDNASLLPPQDPHLPREPEDAIPEGCTSWYDGCNTCAVLPDGTLGPCTLRACIRGGEAKCLAYAQKEGVCRPTGCNGEICADREIVSTCEWRDEYECYRHTEVATCERQDDGQCGWTDTEQLAECLDSLKKEERDCERDGGQWMVGSLAIPQCYMPTKDAGKECTDSSQCEVLCEVDDATQTVGKCSATKPFDGCAKVLRNGVFDGEICT